MYLPPRSARRMAPMLLVSARPAPLYRAAGIPGGKGRAETPRQALVRELRRGWH